MLQPTGDLGHNASRPMARTLKRPSIRVKSVATPGRPLHLDNVVQRHPRGVNAKLSTSKPCKEQAEL